ncbi:hypothetical protein WJX75_001807 [Coccomyxa subellipsoidea]|uniref:TPR-like protein n=1 Tax=Coccomyxa subellipsoidea TaxID=248742 RepID=A0ABR2YDJ1_9CHLO
MGIVSRLETREEAEWLCAQYDTDIEGRNHPVPDEPYVAAPEEELKGEGNRLFSLRRYAKGAEKYTEAPDHDSKSAVLLSNRAIAYLRMGLHAKALTDAEEAISQDPQYIKAHARKGQALEKLGRVKHRTSRTCSQLNSATGRDLGFIYPDLKQQGYMIAVGQSPEESIVGTKMTHGRPTVEEVITCLQVSMAFPAVGEGRRPMLEHDTDIEGHNNPVSDKPYEAPPAEKLKDEGNDLFVLRRYAKAAEKYSEAMAFNPKSAVLFSNRAIAYLHMGLHAKALGDAEEAIKLDPEYIKAHARKGLALEKLGRGDEARTLYQHCITHFKRNSHFRDALQKLEQSL